MRNIFNIDLNKLRVENANINHRLRDKTDQYQKLLNEFKDLEARLSEEQRSMQNRAEDLARKKATLECEINLTRNVAKGIERVAEGAKASG
jgi:predicted nuclease with TOPRIM domain